MPHKDPEEARAWRKRNGQRRVNNNRRWRSKDPLANRKSWLRRYDITLEEFERLFEKQDKRCACCLTETTTQWCVDHDHAVGLTAVRGILCTKCNSIIALMGDTLDSVVKMRWELGIRYLSDISPRLSEQLKVIRTER